MEIEICVENYAIAICLAQQISYYRQTISYRINNLEMLEHCDKHLFPYRRWILRNRMLYYLLQKWDETSIAILFSSSKTNDCLIYHYTIRKYVIGSVCFVWTEFLLFSYFIGYLRIHRVLRFYSSWEEKKRKGKKKKRKLL